jgi:hypothetical protein
MSVDDITAADGDRKKNRYHFDRHTPEYRLQFEKITEEMQSKCPVAWTETYNGHWVAADSKHVFELARCPAVSNHHDLTGDDPSERTPSGLWPSDHGGVVSRLELRK